MSRLRTPRMLLREFRTDDVDALVELDSDPEVMFYINGGRPTPRAEIENEFLPHWLAWYRQGTGYGMWAAEDAEGTFLGWFHLRPGADDDPDEPELGYRLRRAVWGRGLASEGARALVDEAFGELGAGRVRAETMVVNTASRRVMEKAGLRHVRTFFADWPDKIPGDELGDVEYAITRDEWLAARR
jgi:RimJ/RimL family protein N-acetyltransferase